MALFLCELKADIDVNLKFLLDVSNGPPTVRITLLRASTLIYAQQPKCTGPFKPKPLTPERRWYTVLFGLNQKCDAKRLDFSILSDVCFASLGICP